MAVPPVSPSSDTPRVQRRSVPVGGHALAVTEAGPADGEVVVLLHGLLSDSGTWDRAVEHLAGHGLRVLAVDQVGHGESDKPAGGYLLDDFTASLMGLLDALDIGSATLCGHSLGGAIAMHTAVRYPERIGRLVLVSAGGLGREVHPVLRAAALPVAPFLLRQATRPTLRRLYARPWFHKLLRMDDERLTNMRRIGGTVGSAAGQAAFFASLRGVIEPGGQRGSFLEMGVLAAHVPTLLVWNEGDPIIPVAHARAAHEHLPGSRLVVFEADSHEPHRGNAERFAAEVAAFVRETPLSH